MKIELNSQDWVLVNTFLRETDLGDIRRICSKYCIEDQAHGIDHALWNLYQEIRKELQKEEEIKIAEKKVEDNLRKAIERIEVERENYRNEY